MPSQADDVGTFSGFCDKLEVGKDDLLEVT
jgi:hypothetical protein